MRAICVLVLALSAVCAAAGDFSVDGYVAGGAIAVESPPSWLSGGFGRFPLGDTDSDQTADVNGEARVQIEWANSSDTFRVHLLPIARYEPDSAGTDEFGLAEAYVDFNIHASDSQRFRIRGGQFFLGTSRENVEIGWTSPYTITYSAINSWIGEEVRPIGIDLDYRLSRAANDSFSVGATAFRGNDTMGTLLAWRGWSMGERLSVYDEVVPIPPLESIENYFVYQRNGTTPFTSDLDGRTGYAFRARWQRGDTIVLQATHLDNRGDRNVYGVEDDNAGPGPWNANAHHWNRTGEYAWDTRFMHYDAEVNVAAYTVAAEYIVGSTAMGHNVNWWVDTDFDSGYLLASWKPSAFRVTARYDFFAVDDIDMSAAENNEDEGDAWTVAVFWEPVPAWRVGVEGVDLNATHPVARNYGVDDLDGRMLRAEVRFRF
ncbi:MAG: porin family protein [Thermoanaerobaculia bacterium]